MHEPLPGENLAEAVRLGYRTAFNQAVDAGRATPLLIPYSLLGAFIVPTLWLAIPHVQRPWLYSTRWLVMLFVVAFNLNVVRTTSSTNMACSYAAGLMSAWGIVSNANLLVWRRPQFDAARVVRRKRGQVVPVSSGGVGATTGFSNQDGNGYASGAIGKHSVIWKQRSKVDAPVTQGDLQDEGGDSELVWQRFPADASFSHRLDWAFDLACSFRGAGWTHCVSSIPRPKVADQVAEGSPVDLRGMPKVTDGGYERCISGKELLRKRLSTAALCYLALDFLSVFMVKDPYFIFGPDHPYPLPGYLQGLSPHLLRAYRQLFVLTGVYSSIVGIFSLSDVTQYHLGRSVFPRYAELWLYPSTFGSLSAVFDRGLAGWWGVWWHQTFRMQFLAPSVFLRRHGYGGKGSLAGALLGVFLAFAQSGFLHASGSATSIPPTKIWRSPAFFLLQGLGVVFQHSLSVAAKRYLPPMPRILCRAVNTSLALGWLHLTADLFVDDLSSCGLWLFEPVPVSLLRWLGLGHPGDHWWRWDREQFPKWYSGLPWYKMGVAL